MKILAIMGSPRKRDSYQITRVFEEKLNALEKVEFKYLFLKEVLDSLEMTARGWGFNVAGNLGVIAPAFQHAPEYRTKVITEIETLSQNLLDVIKTRKRPSPTLDDLIFFRAMKCKIAPLFCSEICRSLS